MRRDLSCITDVMPTALSLLTTNPWSEHNLLETRAQTHVDHVIVWVIDGLGYDQVVKALTAGWMPNLGARLNSPDNHLERLTTVNPSMTPVALASLLTGAYPSKHGLLGQALYDNGQAIDVFKGPLPESFGLASPTIAYMAERLGVPYHAVLDHRILKGALTQLLHRDTHHISTYIRDSGLSAVANHVLAKDDRSLIYLYSSGIDAINHRRGAYTAEWVAEIQSIDRHLENFQSPLGQTTSLWITADHGHIPIHGEISYTDLAAELPWLPPQPAAVGTAISVNVESMDALHDALHRITTIPVRIASTADYAARGYFGPGDVSAFLNRLGTHLIIPEPGFSWAISPSEPLCWSHGGNHPEEMAIPWIEIKL